MSEKPYEGSYVLKPEEGDTCPFYNCRDTKVEDKKKCNQYECPYHEVEEFMCEW